MGTHGGEVRVRCPSSFCVSETGSRISDPASLAGSPWEHRQVCAAMPSGDFTRGFCGSVMPLCLCQGTLGTTCLLALLILFLLEMTSSSTLSTFSLFALLNWDRNAPQWQVPTSRTIEQDTQHSLHSDLDQGFRPSFKSQLWCQGLCQEVLWLPGLSSHSSVHWHCVRTAWQHLALHRNRKQKLWCHHA